MNTTNNKANQYDLLVFDWDGTLVNSIGFIIKCVQSAAADLGLPVPTQEAIRPGIGLGFEEQVRRIFPGVPFGKFADSYHHHYFSGDGEIHFYENALTTLNTLKARGFTLAIATNKIRTELDKALKASSLDTLFAASRCADDSFPKPNPAMLLDLLQELDVSSKQAIMIGDTTHDMQFAQNAKVAGLGVTYGIHNRAELMRYNPVAIVDEVSELIKVL